MNEKKKKKNIEVYSGYDKSGMWTLNITKKRGKLTLEEIRQACIDYEQDFYMLVIVAMEMDVSQYYEVDDLMGDSVTLYSANDFFGWRAKE